MLDTRSPLISEFLKDHQQFSRLLYEISNLLEKGNLDKARERALELDVVAGPHIAYEEAEMYSRLADLGEESVSEKALLDEHQLMLNGMRPLLDGEPLSDEKLETIKAAFKAALSHAEHCGSLISLISQLDPEAQAVSLEKLRAFREDGKKWTEL